MHFASVETHSQCFKTHWKCSSTHLQCVENALQRKNSSTLFSLSLLFPNRVTITSFQVVILSWLTVDNKQFLEFHSPATGPQCYEFECFKWQVVCSLVRTQGCRKQQQGYLFHSNAIIPHETSQQHTLGF